MLVVGNNGKSVKELSCRSIPVTILKSEFSAEKTKKQDGSSTPTTEEPEEDGYLDENIKKIDDSAMQRIQQIMLDYDDDMKKHVPSANAQLQLPKTGNFFCFIILDCIP